MINSKEKMETDTDEEESKITTEENKNVTVKDLQCSLVTSKTNQPESSKTNQLQSSKTNQLESSKTNQPESSKTNQSEINQSEINQSEINQSKSKRINQLEPSGINQSEPSEINQPQHGGISKQVEKSSSALTGKISKISDKIAFQELSRKSDLKGSPTKNSEKLNDPSSKKERVTASLKRSVNDSLQIDQKKIEKGKMTVDMPEKITKKVRKDFRFQSELALKPTISSLELVESEISNFVSFAAPDVENDKELTMEDNEISVSATATSPIIQSTDGEGGNPLIPSVILFYPGAKDVKEEFPLVVPKTKQDYSPLHDLYTSVQFIAQECLKDDALGKLGDKKEGILRHIIKACHKKNPTDIKKFVNDFNSTLFELQSANQLWIDSEPLNTPASHEFCKHILEQSYARTVAPKAHLLRNYEGFSNNVYGEITPLFVSEIIRNANIEPDSVFLDMGSGTGNVVLQVAAEVCCESYGIEIMDAPASLAKKQRTEFLGRMRMYGKPCGRIYLKQGDFLLDDGIHSVITKADVIFVNNYAFHADVNLQLLAKFLDVKPTCRIVSLRSFVSLRGGNSSSSGRFSNSMETKFRVKEFFFPRNSVSWMPEGGSYYIHYVNQ